MSEADEEWEAVVRRPQQFRKAPQRIDDLLSKLLSRRGYGQVQVANELRSLWSQVVLGRLSQDSQPAQFRQGTLDVVAKNSAVVQELTFQTTTIIKKISQLSPQLGVKKLRIRVGELG